MYFKMSPRRDWLLFFLQDLFIFLFSHTCMFHARCFPQRTYMAQGLVNRVRFKSAK